MPDVDTSVLVILDEEIQPYLEGQKSLDEVIDVAENRINLMIDERGELFKGKVMASLTLSQDILSTHLFDTIGLSGKWRD